MVRLQAGNIIVFLLIVNSLTGLQINNTEIDKNNHLETRRKSSKTKKDRSTSSSSGEGTGIRKVSESESGISGESLDLSSESSESESSSPKKHKDKKPKSSAERRGWRKWHRKCQPCPEDMKKKWRDPSISWICGAYQRARRSFKSLCMMHYRNCQDGTMFTKIGDHRCTDDSPGAFRPHGDHFFYDYDVHLSDETSRTKSTSGSAESTDTDSSI